DNRTRHIPIIALTAHTVDNSQDKALIAGCDHYLAKPIGRIDLLKAVQQYLTYVNPSEEANHDPDSDD
ncbi:MAG TPA: hypothetical protein VHL11_09865, partial [Phototrophicaceae bacterium]|nr:hypothetical protein [Phototrophicaceae bacterium]